MPVASRDTDPPHGAWKRPRGTPPGIIAIPDDPHVAELLAQAHQVAERHEEERATVYLTEILTHGALPIDALHELRRDLLMLEMSLRARASELQSRDPALLDYRSASAHLDRVCLHHAGRALDRSLANAGVTLVIVHA